MNERHPARLAAGAVVIAALAASCSSTKTTTAAGPSTTAGGRSAAPATPASGVDPNAAESSPPGDIPDDQVFVSYTPPAGGMTLTVPEGWSRTETAGVITFTDNLDSIRIETVSTPTAPTAASATAQDVPAVQAQVPGFEAGKVTTVDRRAGKAVLITYRDVSAPDPVTKRRVTRDVERYEFWSNGTEVVLTLAGPKGADNVDPWRIVTDSFTFQT